MGIVSIGQAVSRFEDPRLLRGEGRYTGDVDLDGQTYGYVLRSPHAHARILAIDTAAAKAAPGVLTVLTGQDYIADGLGVMPVLVSPAPGFDAEAFFNPDHFPLAVNKLRFVGEPVAFVVAETLAQARDAAELVEIDAELLPAVIDTGHADAADAPLLWEGRGDNKSFGLNVGDAAATEAAFAAADKIVSHRFVIQRLAVNTLENRATVAAYDAATECFSVHVATQGAFATRGNIAAKIFDIPVDKVHVMTGDIGGSFGMKGFYPETVSCLWAAKRLGRPVKWVNDRQDSLQSDTHGRDKIFNASLALGADGKFLGLRAEVIANLGAYVSLLGTMHTTLSTSGLVGVYDIPAAHVSIAGYFTNTTPTGPYRGAGRPDVAYVLERLIDIAAVQSGIDRVTLRRRNLIASSAMPYRTALGPAYDSGDFARNMDAALGAMDFEGFEARRAEAAKTGRLRGFGFANNIENAGAPGQEFAELAFAPDGSAIVAAGTTDHGQGHATLYAQVVSDRLGIDADTITVKEGDTALLDNGSGTGGSRVSAMGTGAVVTVVDQVIEKGKQIAAHMMETAAADIEFSDGRFGVVGTDQAVTFDDVLTAAFSPDQLPGGMESGLTARGVYVGKAASFPNGCHACEIEIDPETGIVELMAYVGANDLGTVINPLQVKGQLDGGIVQGIGQVLMEAVVYDGADGQLRSGSFQDYRMPRGDDFCAFEYIDNPTATAANPLGAKGVGEVGTACAIPAVVNAVIDALAPVGVTHLDTPLTPQKIWQVVQDARR